MSKQKNMMVVIPLHKYNEEISTLLKEAIKSVPQTNDITISCASDIVENINNDFGSIENITVLPNKTDKNDFCTLVNNGVNKNYKYFSVLEYYDTFTPIWFNNLEKYITFDPEASAFLPLEEILDYSQNKKVIGICNESAWSSSFVKEIGTIDEGCLKDFHYFVPTGGAFSVADWLEVGGLKSNVENTFWYELLLRMTKKNNKIKVIPKIGLNHYVNKIDSLSTKYPEVIKEDEQKYWLSVAKKESFFKDEREIEPFEEKK